MRGKTDSFIHPLPGYGGQYPNNWAGYIAFQPRTPEGYPNRRHLGVDYNGSGGGDSDLGMDVVCMGHGIVEACIYWDGKSYGFGNHVFVRHELSDRLYEAFKQPPWGIDSRIVYSHYAHLDKIAVRVGQEISKGELIGKCGKSGTSWAHLHSELRKPTGMGYESYPSSEPLEWQRSYYFDNYVVAANYSEDASTTTSTTESTSSSTTTTTHTTTETTTESTNTTTETSISTSSSTTSSSTSTTSQTIPPDGAEPPSNGEDDDTYPSDPTSLLWALQELTRIIAEIIKFIFGKK